MSHATVYEILERIEQLPVEERLLLDDLLTQREEAEWRQEAAQARQVARDRGIDQEAIDRAVHRVRHGA
ncbi:MAG TPA: hypothetical protein VF017_18075 [Thermoanaerobaculia bacterium]|nr:hypothetical protein [Thermoanaerobaculia bacterium]